MWHQWFNCNFMKQREYILCAKKTKIMTLFNNFFSSDMFMKTVFMYSVRSDCMFYVRTPAPVLWCYHERAAEIDTEEKKLLNKVVIFVFFADKKYSRSFIKLRLNHWCHMDYFNDVFTMFLCLDLAVYGRVREL